MTLHKVKYTKFNAFIFIVITDDPGMMDLEEYYISVVWQSYGVDDRGTVVRFPTKEKDIFFFPKTSDRLQWATSPFLPEVKQTVCEVVTHFHKLAI